MKYKVFIRRNRKRTILAIEEPVGDIAWIECSRKILGATSFVIGFFDEKFHGMVSSPRITKGILEYLFGQEGHLEKANGKSVLRYETSGLGLDVRWNIIDDKRQKIVNGEYSNGVESNFILRTNSDDTFIFSRDVGNGSEGVITTTNPPMELIAAILIVDLVLVPNEPHSFS